MRPTSNEAEEFLHMDEKQVLTKIAMLLRENRLITPEEEIAMIEQISKEA